MTERHDVTIVGGGLVGSLLAIFLVRRGKRVTVREQRPDIRKAGAEGGRSINLVISSRGIRALRQVGLDEVVSRITVPVAGRMMHSVAGELTYQPYGRDDSECNYSVSRGELNRLLIEQAEQRGVRFEFASPLGEGDLEAVAENADLVVGADGAGSAVRASFHTMPGFEESLEPLTHGYKELLIPLGADGVPQVEKNALHIWPRGERALRAAVPRRDPADPGSDGELPGQPDRLPRHPALPPVAP
jgi:kynurenine 3-monooxygenase